MNKEINKKKSGLSFDYAKDNLEKRPWEYYKKEFYEADPVSISNRLGIPYDTKESKFTLAFMGTIYQVSHPEFKISHKEDKKNYYPLMEDINAKIVILRYLLKANVFPHNGDFRSYRELPSGDVYYNQFYGRCILKLEKIYGNRHQVFKQVMDHLDARSIQSGDIAYELEFLDDFYIQFILWKGDEEFQASSQILFSSNFSGAFAAYDLAEIGEICIKTFRQLEEI